MINDYLMCLHDLLYVSTRRSKNETRILCVMVCFDVFATVGGDTKRDLFKEWCDSLVCHGVVFTDGRNHTNHTKSV